MRYVSHMVCIGTHDRQGADRDGNMLRAIVFELVPLDEFTGQQVESGADDPVVEPVSLEELRQRALAAARGTRNAVERRAVTHHRNHAVRAYVLHRADGHCEGCGAAAPFWGVV